MSDLVGTHIVGFLTHMLIYFCTRFLLFLAVECDQLEGLQDGSYVVSSNGITSEVIYSCADGYTLSGSSQANCQENGTWTITSKPYCCMKIHVR